MMIARNEVTTANRRVLILDNKSLLGAGLEKLLVADKQLQVLGTNTRNELDLVAEIQEAKPDTVILDAELHTPCMTKLWHCLQTQPHMQIILVRVGCNVVEIFGRRQFVVEHETDLIDAILRR